MNYLTTWPSTNPVKLIRYLIIWRVNTSLARVPNSFEMELSQVLGSLIANRLPTKEAEKWRKALNKVQDFKQVMRDAPLSTREKLIPEIEWPINASIYIYPGKMIYGKKELIFWELKLFGDDANHEYFIEVILPAIEEAGYFSGSKWNYNNGLWGHFDVDTIHVARGCEWEPLVSQGQLDLKYRANASQWSEGVFETNNPFENDHSYRKLTWLSAFDFGGIFSSKKQNVQIPGETQGIIDATPSLYGLLEALIIRLHCILSGRRTAPENIWNIFTNEERSHLQNQMEYCYKINTTRSNLIPVQSRPGRWIGSQVFSYVPLELKPYLLIASILHLGRQTHVGCGTFYLSKLSRKDKEML